MSIQSRQPKGVPSGGQFAGVIHDEAHVVLAQDPRVEAPPTATDRAAGVELQPNWRAGQCFFSAGEDAQSQIHTALIDYDQWQVRADVLGQAADDGDVSAGEQLDDLNDEMTYLVHRLVEAYADRRPAVRLDPNWQPEQIYVRHEAADGPSLDELVSDYDQWQHRVEVLSAEDRLEEVDDLNSDMRYLVHEIAHRLKLQSESASAA